MNKRDDWGFLEFGQVEVDNITSEIDLYLEEWTADTSRQETFETHQHTFCISLRQLDYLHELGSPGTCKKTGSLKNLLAQQELDSIISLCEQAGDGKAIRVEFVSMRPDSRVRTHKDRSDLLYVAKRYHVPIKSNNLVTFISGKYTKHLEVGNIYELNNINYHSVHNKSKENRIHLIIDVLPKEFLENISFEE